MISTVTWIQRNVAKSHPTKADLSEEVYEDLVKKFQDRETSQNLDLKTIRENMVTPNEEDDMISKNQLMEENDTLLDEKGNLSIYQLDTYDEESIQLPLFSNLKGLMYHASNKDDPYIVLKEEEVNQVDEQEDMEIHSDDLLLLIGRTEDDVSQLEMYIYEEKEDNLYIHHDVMLSTFPLCTEWLNFNGKPGKSRESGNFVAVGTFQSEIELWDLDIIDPFYPHAILGEEKKKEGHREAVLSLSWNQQHR
jgi:periodic tryptophan protein 1